jgi:hypothetical protein
MYRQLKQTALPYQSEASTSGRITLSPCHQRPLPDIGGCVFVRVGAMATGHTLEGCLVWSVPFVDMTAHAALLRCVTRINKGHRHACALRFIGNKPAKLRKRPVSKPCSLVAVSGRYPAADTLELLKTYPSRGAFSIPNKPLRQDVVHMLLVSPLFASQFLQAVLSAVRVIFLQAASTLGEMICAESGCKPALTNC